MRVVAALAIACLFSSVLLTSARAQSDEDFGPTLFADLTSVRGVAHASPDSHIEITNAFGTIFNEVGAYGVISPTPVECVFFVNHAPRAARRVQFRLAYVGENGKELGHDTIDMRGTFATGVPNGAWPHGALGSALGSNCQTFRGMDHGEEFYHTGWYHKFYYEPARQVATLVVSVDKVEYDDGTAWSAPAP